MEWVEKYVKVLKGNVGGWEGEFGKEMMRKGKGWMKMRWRGEGEWGMEEGGRVGVEVGYRIGEEGRNVW